MDKRTLKVVAISAGIVFPHAVQAIQITRKTRKLNGKKWRTEVVYAVTSLTPAQATDAELAAGSAATGAWRTACTGSATSPSTRTAPRSAPATDPASCLPAQPRHQHRAPGWRQQHRPSPTASRMGPAQARSTTPDQLRWDFAGVLSIPRSSQLRWQA